MTTPAEHLLAEMNLTDARTGIASAARRAHRQGQETVLTDRGEQLAVVISIDEYKRLRQLEDETELAELRRRQQYAGAWMSHDQVVAGAGFDAS